MRGPLIALLLVGCAGGEDVRFVPDTDPTPTFVGAVEITPTELVIAPAVPGEFLVGTVTVTNVGEYDLTLVSAEMVEDADDALVTDAETNGDRVIARDRSFEVLIRCQLPVPDEGSAPDVQGLLRVRTNDPDNPEVDVTVRCSTDG